MSIYSAFASDNLQPLITHKNETEQENINLSLNLQRLERANNLALPLAKEKHLLKQLLEFELGRFLLANKGLNGYWTSYIIIHGPKKTNITPLEKWILQSAPMVKATQERFKIFQHELQKQLKSGTKMASIPCGLMDDVLGLDYNNFVNIKLVGIDLDDQSLQMAQGNAQKYGINNVEFIKKDAWNLGTNEEYDLITSNGLNIYQPDDKKVVELYKEFYKKLKPSGILITSFLTPPPTLSVKSTWKNYNQKDLLKQKAIFSDIIQVTWQAFRTQSQTEEQLENAGFKVLEVIYDSQGMFPTIIAKK
jgi:ubiquinone/menaquinone biosynthesis C-methylase UbiE